MAGITVDFCTAAAAGATASSLVVVQGGIFDVVVFQIAWNTTNTLYVFFVVFLFLVLGRGTGRRFCLVGFVVVFVGLCCLTSLLAPADFLIVLSIAGGNVGDNVCVVLVVAFGVVVFSVDVVFVFGLYTLTSAVVVGGIGVDCVVRAV